MTDDRERMRCATEGCGVLVSRPFKDALPFGSFEHDSEPPFPHTPHRPPEDEGES